MPTAQLNIIKEEECNGDSKSGDQRTHKQVLSSYARCAVVVSRNRKIVMRKK